MHFDFPIFFPRIEKKMEREKPTNKRNFRFIRVIVFPAKLMKTLSNDLFKYENIHLIQLRLLPSTNKTKLTQLIYVLQKHINHQSCSKK